MRAKLIYEKFTEESDPIEDMGVGFKPISDFRKNLKELGKLPDQDLSKINFRDNSQKISQLREISGDLVMFYFAEKYGLDFKFESSMFRGSNIGRAKLGKWLFDLNWSTTMQSIKLTVSDGHGWQGIWKESSNCQSMRPLEQSLLNFCKELNITLPKQPDETRKRKIRRKV
jgi:hypothetical protein